VLSKLGKFRNPVKTNEIGFGNNRDYSLRLIFVS